MRAISLSFLRTELRQAVRWAAERVSRPVEYGGFQYYRNERGDEVRRPVGSAGSEGEEVVIAASRGEHIAGAAVSQDGTRVAWVAESGDERGRLRVRRLGGAPMTETLPEGLWRGASVREVQWDASGRYLFCTVAAASDLLRASQLWLYDVALGSARCVLEEPDATATLQLGTSKDRRFIRIARLSHSSSQHWIVPADDALRQPRLMWPARPNQTYSVDHLNDGAWIVFHKEENSLFVGVPGTEWHMFYRAPADMAVTDVDVFRSSCVVYGYDKGWPVVMIVPYDSALRAIRVPLSPATYVSPGSNLEMDTETINFSVASPVQPPMHLSCDLASGIISGWRNDRTLVDHAVTVVTTPSGIPITFVRGASMHSPCLLQVYGAYGAVWPPACDPSVKPLLDRGWSLAFAHVRGGGMLGPSWHQAGRGTNRHAASDDLIECGTTLRKTVARGKMFVSGFSAGGFTVASAVHQARAKGLFNGVVLQRPFLNPLATLQDTSAPLSEFERGEWGTEESLKAIDPLHTLDGVQHELPPIFISRAVDDQRVSLDAISQYYEKAKKKTLRIECYEDTGGHFGDVVGSRAWIDLKARELHFLLKT